jgi:RND family efflux transporter MFP subunit
MRIVRQALLIAVVVVAAGGCGKKNDKPALPPARGPGAAPLPALPEVVTGAGGAGAGAAAGAEATAVAPTEGRTTGTTYPRSEAQVAAKASGVIERVMLKDGDRVRRGTVLFRQDQRDAVLRVEQAKAAVSSARVGVKAIETEHSRSKSLFDEKALSRMEWDQIQARFDGARANLEQAEVALRIAEKGLADTSVRSPIDGVVTAKLKSEGEMATMMPPTVVLVVQDQSVLDLKFRLPERALATVKVGDIVKADFEAIGAVREAKVTRINPAVDPRTRTVEVVAEIPNKEGRLRSGLLASVELPGARR